MTYSFRWPFTFPVGPQLPYRTQEWVVRTGEQWKVSVTSAGAESLSDSQRPVLAGWGFVSEASALNGARSARDALERVFATLGIGAYFDHRAGGSLSLSQALMDSFRKKTGHPLRPDNAGPTVFATDLEPVFMSMQAEGRSLPPVEMFDGAIASAAAWAAKSGGEHTAYAIYSAAGAARSDDAHLLMLVMAVEVLADAQPRSAAALAHIDQLMQATKEANLGSEDKTPLISALGNLRTESARSACRRHLGEHLGERTYAGSSAGDFFAKCYGIRSRLTHGGMRPQPSELSEWVSVLGRLVGDLLAGAELAAWRDEWRRPHQGN